MLLWLFGLRFFVVFSTDRKIVKADKVVVVVVVVCKFSFGAEAVVPVSAYLDGFSAIRV